MTEPFALNLKGTRTSDRWGHKTGNLDPLNTATIWLNADEHGIPLLEATQSAGNRYRRYPIPKVTGTHSYTYPSPQVSVFVLVNAFPHRTVVRISRAIGYRRRSGHPPGVPPMPGT